MVIYVGLFKQTPTRTGPHKGKGILPGNEKSSIHGVDEKDHIVLTMTNAFPSRVEGVKVLYVRISHRARVL